MGIIQGMKRWQNKRKVLFALTQCCLFYHGLKKNKGYILTSGLKTHLRGELHSLGKYAYLKKVFEFGRKMLVI